MSREFSSGNYLSVSTPVLTAAAFTFACFFRSTSATARQTLITIKEGGAGANTSEGWYLQLRGDLSDQVRFSVRAGGGATVDADTSTPYSTNTWHHAVAREIASNSRSVSIDGGSTGTNGFGKTPDPGQLTTTLVGAGGPTASQEMVGLIAFPAIWNVALDDREVAALAAGIPPWMIRPASLVACWPMPGDSDGNEKNWWPGSYELTENGTVGVGSSNPPIVMPFPWMRPGLSEVIAGGGGGGPAAQDYYLLRARRRGRR